VALKYLVAPSVTIPAGYTLSWFRFNGEKWLPVPSIYSPAGRTVTAEVREFSYYGVFKAAIPFQGAISLSIDTMVTCILTEEFVNVTITDDSAARPDEMVIGLNLDDITPSNVAALDISIPAVSVLNGVLSTSDSIQLINNYDYFKWTVRDISLTPFNPVRDTVSLTYKVSDEALAEAGTDELSWFTFNSSAGWIKLNSVFDKTNKTVYTTEIEHFSYFAVFPAVNHAKAASDLNEITVYPNPFRPNDGKPSTGINYSPGVEGSGIYINGLVPGTKLRIYNLVGELVKEVVCPAGTGSVVWDATNLNGVSVASGMYVMLAKNGGEDKIKKILIIK